jgi:chaperonin GroES
MTTTIRPLHDRILVKRLDAESTTPGGLIIPDNAKEKPVRAIVVAVGSGKRDREGAIVPPDVAAGDCVVFSKYSGAEVQIDGVDHTILREEDILAVLT